MIQKLMIIFYVMLALAVFTVAGEELSPLTGARTRVVWVQDISPEASDTFAEGRNLRLMGFDTEDGKGERIILPGPGNYNRPLITSRGDRIVFSDVHKKKAYIVDWDGTDLRELIDGVALDVWIDSETGIEWVYMGTDAEKRKGIVYNTVKRHQIDNPDKSELIWNHTPVSSDNFQVSADGTRVAAQFPWPNCGIAMLPNKSWQQYSRGCWTSLSPDNSYLLWVFDGMHRHITIYSPLSGESWRAQVNTAPDVRGYEVYHPRWSNHVRFMALTGPYTEGKGSNRIRGGGDQVEIYVGRFNSEFNEIEKWARVTHNDMPDFYPDVWIKGGENVNAGLDIGRVSPAKAEPGGKWPAATRGLIFIWENADKQNELPAPDEDKVRLCRVTARGLARFGRYFEMVIKDGAFIAEDADKRLVEACKATNELTIEALITPASLDQHGPARIISFSSSAVSRNFTLGQEKDELVLRLRTPETDENGIPQAPLCKLTVGEPQHVIVSYSPGKIAFYLNGERRIVPPVIRGDFSNWSEQHLIFGDEWTGKRNWTGRLEGIAIYNRFLAPGEARQAYSLYAKRLEKRDALKQITVKAKLLKISSTPRPEDIAPYRRALAAYTYEVQEVLSGEKFDADKIMVAHWVIMDGKVRSIPQNEKGKTYMLTLEQFEEHPELESERLIMEVDEFDSPFFYEVPEFTNVINER